MKGIVCGAWPCAETSPARSVSTVISMMSGLGCGALSEPQPDERHVATIAAVQVVACLIVLCRLLVDFPVSRRF